MSAPDAGRPTVPWRSRTVQVILVSTALAPFGVPLIAPALPVVRDAFGLSDAGASLLVSAYFVVGVVLSPFIGMLVDRAGRKRVLVASLLVFGVAGGTIAFATDYAVVLALRVIGGTAAAGLFITTVTLIGDCFEGVQRNAVFGLNVAVLSAAAALYPVLGGALVALGWNVPFLLYFAALPVAAFALTLDEPTVERNVRGLAYLRGAAGVLANRTAVGLYGAAFVTELLLFGTVLTALPFLLEDDYALAPVAIGAIITATEVASVAFASQNGRFARHLSNWGLIGAGFVCIGAGLVGAWLAPSPAFVAVAMLGVGAGLGLSMPAIDAAVSDLAAGQYRAGAMSIRNSTTFLGRAAGPVVFVGLAVTTGYPTLLLAGGILAFVVATIALALPRRNRRIEPPAAESIE